MYIIAVAAQKGGTGKTSTALALAAGLVRAGRRVLTIDLDQQCNLSYVVAQPSTYTSFSLLSGSPIPSDFPFPDTPCGRVIVAEPRLMQLDNRAHALRPFDKALLTTGVEWVILDCPPNLGPVTQVALASATHALIPVLPSVLSLQALSQMLKTIADVRLRFNQDLSIAGIVLNQYDARRRTVRDLMPYFERAAEQMGTRLCDTRIRRCAAIEAAQAARTDIYSYDRSNAALDFAALTVELIKIVQHQC